MSSKQERDVVLEERQEVLLKIIESFSKVLDYPTSALLHDYILLCRMRAKDVRQLRDYAFRAYMRGAFSDQLRADLEVLGQHSLIDTHHGRLTVSNKGKELLKHLTQTGRLQYTTEACDKILAEHRSPHAISQGIQTLLNQTQLGEVLSLP